MDFASTPVSRSTTLETLTVQMTTAPSNTPEREVETPSVLKTPETAVELSEINHVSELSRHATYTVPQTEETPRRTVSFEPMAKRAASGTYCMRTSRSLIHPRPDTSQIIDYPDFAFEFVPPSHPPTPANIKLRQEPTAEPPAHQFPEVGKRVRDLPEIVRRWNLTFSGKRDASVEEFLHRIEECRKGSQLTYRDLIEAAPFLLTDKALHWFRLHKTEWIDWLEFAVAFRCRFGGMNFQYRVRDEARRQTQGPDEPIAD